MNSETKTCYNKFCTYSSCDKNRNKILEKLRLSGEKELVNKRMKGITIEIIFHIT